MIRLIAACALAMAFCVTAALAQTATDAPLVLFPLSAADKTLADSAAIALKASLKQGQNVQVIEYRPEIPSLRRAVMEGALTKNDLEAADPATRLKVARALDAGFFMTGNVERDAEGVRLAVTAVDTRRGQNHTYNSKADSPTGDASGALLSVANTVATQFLTQVLNVVPPAAPVVLNLPLPPVTAEGTSGGESNKPEPPAKPAEAPAPAGPNPRIAAQDSLRESAAGYAAQSETLAAEGDLAGAIQAMREAVNLAPGDVSHRLQLAKLYTDKNMPEEATKELERAAALNPASDEVRNALARERVATASPEEAVQVYRDILKSDPKNLEARLALGDALWNEGKPGGAALEYAQAANDHPDQPGPYYRLARLAAARGQFMDATGHVASAKHTQNQNDGAPVEAGLYKSLAQSADMAYYRYRDQLDTMEKDHAGRAITREDYYGKVRALLTEVEQLADFLSDLNAPAGYSKAHLHRSLAASLMAQAVTSLQEWLHKDEAALKQNAQGFLKDSQSEMDSAAAAERKLRAD